MLWLSNPIHGLYPPKKNTCIQKDLAKHVRSAFIHNSPKLETTQIPFSKISKLWSIHKIEQYTAVMRNDSCYPQQQWWIFKICWEEARHKTIQCVTSLMHGSEIDKTGLWRWKSEQGLHLRWHEETFWVIEILIAEVITWVCTCVPI